MSGKMSRSNKKLFMLIALLGLFSLILLYFLKPTADRMYVEAFNCVDYETAQITEKQVYSADVLTVAFARCDAQINALVKSIYFDLIANGRANYVTTNIDYYFYKLTNHFIFGMDDIVRQSITDTTKNEFANKLHGYKSRDSLSSVYGQ